MMKTMVILGAGTGGTMVANKLAARLEDDWRIVVIDKDEAHLYQPGLLFIPFGMYKAEDVVRTRRDFLPRRVEFIVSDIELIEPEQRRVHLTNNYQHVDYDVLVIATGTHIRPDLTPGLLDGGGWRNNIFDFYTLHGAVALADALEKFDGGRLVINIAEMPIKCPVAPLEFAFLADWYLKRHNRRHKTDIVFVTPLSGAFTKPIASAMLGGLLDEKGIQVVPNFSLSEVDNAKQVIRSYDDQEVGYDMLITIPTNAGAKVIGHSGMGDELNYVQIDKHTLQSKRWDNVFVIGDAGNAPTSKAGSVAHFMLDALLENVLSFINGKPLEARFDGHANCFVETGFEKALLIDFNYETEPLPGLYPLPGFGPMTLLKESHTDHYGKMAFKWVYWNLLLKGRPLPVPTKMSMAGKIVETHV